MSINDFASNGCEVCKAYVSWSEEHAMKCKESDLTGRWTGDLVRESAKILEHCKKHHKDKPKRKYAFTFTTGEDTKLEIQKEMCEAAYKLYTQKSKEIARGEVYLEYTENNRPHLHGWYETEDGGRVYSKIFKRIWPTWGEGKSNRADFIGGYHKEMASEQYKKYASDEGRRLIFKEGTELDYDGKIAITWCGK